MSNMSEQEVRSMSEATSREEAMAEDPTLPSADEAAIPRSTVVPLFAGDPALAKLRRLAETFPTLAVRRIATVDDLKRVALDPNNGRGSREAARFALMVWDSSIGYQDPTLAFDARNAWGAWDVAHRRAWQAWAAAPWFA